MLLPAESVPAMLPLASGFTELALPIRAWAFEAVGCRANSAATATAAVHLWLYIMVAPFARGTRRVLERSSKELIIARLPCHSSCYGSCLPGRQLFYDRLNRRAV